MICQNTDVQMLVPIYGSSCACVYEWDYKLKYKYYYIS